MKNIILNICLILSPLFLRSENLTKKYIRENLPYAIEANAEFGVPISICLGQAILESDRGRSNLARKNNNHFGVRNGIRAKRKGKAYRIYATTAESFRDWAKNLAEYYPYASLFDIPATNFKGWAHGLQKAGYSTSGNYGQVLSKVIEKYGLANLDKSTLARLDCDYLVGWAHENFAIN